MIRFYLYLKRLLSNQKRNYKFFYLFSIRQMLCDAHNKLLCQTWPHHCSQKFAMATHLQKKKKKKKYECNQRFFINSIHLNGISLQTVCYNAAIYWLVWNWFALIQFRWCDSLLKASKYANKMLLLVDVLWQYAKLIFHLNYNY